MLPATCFTCGFCFAKIELDYEEGIAKICKDNDNFLDNDKDQGEILKLLESLNVKRYCCKARVLTYVDEIKIII